MTERVVAPSDPIPYTPGGESFSSHKQLPEVRPEPPNQAASLSQEADVARIFDDPRGRPKEAESLARTSRFLLLIADGMDAEKAARTAKIGPWRALRIVTESDFNDVVRAIREGVADEAQAA